jgi:Transposase DDE domain
MRRRIDSPDGRARYGQRFATVEPVFGNLRHHKRLNRFTLRGRTKVNAQWQLFCLVHNTEGLSLDSSACDGCSVFVTFHVALLWLGSGAVM